MKDLFRNIHKNKEGFTLAELLVVVAILGILVTISIPLFTAQIAKARKATNEANVRAAKAAAVADYLTAESHEAEDNQDDDGKHWYKYDVNAGTIEREIPDSVVETSSLTESEEDISKTEIYAELWVEITEEDGNESKSGGITVEVSVYGGK